MEITKIILIGLTALFLIITLKEYRKEFAVFVSIIAGMLIFYCISDKIVEIISLLTKLSNETKVDFEFIGIVLKITGIAYLTEFGMNICKDSGESALASKIELGGKIIMIYISLPIMLKLLEEITKII